MLGQQMRRLGTQQRDDGIRMSSVVCRLSSVVCRLPSAVCRLASCWELASYTHQHQLQACLLRQRVLGRSMVVHVRIAGRIRCTGQVPALRALAVGEIGMQGCRAIPLSGDPTQPPQPTPRKQQAVRGDSVSDGRAKRSRASPCAGETEYNTCLCHAAENQATMGLPAGRDGGERTAESPPESKPH